VDNQGEEVTALAIWFSTAGGAHYGGMSFEITLTDETVERVDGADSYALEGPLTTFFGNDRPRPLDSWSVKVASYRTDRIARIRRL
jgi:hypothetical protein